MTTIPGTFTLELDDSALGALVEQHVTQQVQAQQIPTQVHDQVVAEVAGADIPGQVSAAVTGADIPGQVADAVAAQVPPTSGGGTGSAYVGLPYTVITQPTDAAVQAGITAWLQNRTSSGFPRTHLLFGFIGEANLTTPLLPSTTGQIQGARIRGLSKRGTILRWSNASVPLLSSYGQLRNWMFEDFTVRGANNAQGFYLRADNSKTNQDGAWKLVEWLGSWQYGIGLDGKDNTANLNSEIVLDRVALGNDASFTGAWLHSGMTDGFNQQNQFLNYTIRDSKLEGSHGDYLRFDYGGVINIEGFSSWIHTGQAATDSVPRGRMIYLPRSGNGDSVMFLTASGMRPELRSQQSVLIDSNWSGAGTIVFQNLASAANSFRVADHEAYIFRNKARVRFDGGHLHGHIGLRGSQANPKVVLDCIGSPGNQGVNAGAVGAGGIVRAYDGGSTANVVIR